MSDSEEIAALLKRLETHRFNVRVRLEQHAKHGAAYVPPLILHDIRDNRREIQYIKKALWERGIPVEDHPDDFESEVQSSSASTPKPGPTVEPIGGQIYTSTSPEELEELWQQAEQAYTSQDWEKAERLLVQVAQVNPRYKEVQRLLHRSRKLFPLLVEYRRLCALDDSQWEEARRGFDRIRQIHPDFIDKQNLLGWIEEHQWCEHEYELAEEYFGYGHTAHARQILTEILEVQPDNRKAQRLLVYVIDLEEQAELHQQETENAQRAERERQLREQEEHQERIRRDVRLLLTVIVVLVILVFIARLFLS